ncbi:phytoene desaturase family protein [Methanosarcina mazei]|uniref:FAD-dependent oxidoreductase n=1 Tax=Methanosarcina mazei TaxID=2209 RepID=A0A0F8ICI8_METMZ|nr:FAD-dependent oxidoreductase [Methanosarcina mazei]KKG73835.1 FAD-dependent oxidoreductase [Methanosarcina mazei]KKG77139.1 FAD-dependent oxidoreductase [Methanosarcina mazei]KKG83669.1 FAD-dependent oxidoreductase [Methanosarcina mazei]KKH11761.1 FAD-dependent oxidoreductase [Methanosarcina mazei]KKH13973.1 FAD-dependent oxidoreductase [Methanosarcina mazei]
MKKIIIIGGGIAGLSAGIFARKNGFESEILEKNRRLGGECTGWDRQGYHIDGCIHWLVGTKTGTPIHDLWITVGALDGVEIFNPESFLAFEHDGVTVHFYRDLDRLKSSWLELSPEDKGAIEDFCQAIKRLQSYEIPVEKPEDLMTLMQRIRLMISLKDAGMVMKKYGKVSLKDYASTFKHPALKAALASFLPESYSASFIFFALAAFTRGQASIPYGGSRALAMRMVERYLSLGGTIEAPCEAIDLNIDHKKISQVICHNGKIFEANYVIAACDAHVLYERLLKGKYSDHDFQKRYSNPADYPLASQILVTLGYEGTADNLPRSLSFPVTPFEIHQSPIDRLTITHYGHEPAFAPEGHTLITCAINQFHEDYDAWDALAQDSDAYYQEKERIANAVHQAIETHFPLMKGKLKVLDVATPKTYERYCNAYRGAFMPFLPTVQGKMMTHTGRIKDLDNLFLTGQWLQPPGGLPVAVVAGKDTIMRICKQEKKPFISC